MPDTHPLSQPPLQLRGGHTTSASRDGPELCVGGCAFVGAAAETVLGWFCSKGLGYASGCVTSLFSCLLPKPHFPAFPSVP